MNIKQAIITRNHKAHDNSFVNDCGIDYRGPRKNYERAYTKEQIDYLFSNGLLEKYEPCGAFWEYSGMGEYWQFTDKGRRWRNWYVCSFWQWVFFHGFLHRLKLYASFITPFSAQFLATYMNGVSHTATMNFRT